MPQTLLLSATYVAVATSVHLILALLSARSQNWFGCNGHEALFRRICALLIAGVALWFLLSTTR